MADYGKGFEEVDGELQCREHGTKYLRGYIDSHDVGATLCLACVPKDELTPEGRREIVRIDAGLSVEGDRRRRLRNALQEFEQRLRNDRLGPQGVAAERERVVSLVEELYA